VIATVITLLFNWIQSNRKNVLERITDERKQWRIEMRQCSEAFQREHCISKSKDLLTGIKVRINALGIDLADCYQDDGHIWRLIDSYEKLAENDNLEQARVKDKIVKVISCLLKNDWERSKSEIMMNRYSLLCMVLCVFFILVFILPSVLLGFVVISDETIGTVVVSVVIIFLLIVESIYNYLLLNKSMKGIKADFFIQKGKLKVIYKFYVEPQGVNLITFFCGLITIMLTINKVIGALGHDALIWGGAILISSAMYNGIVLNNYYFAQKKSIQKYYDAIDRILLL